MEFLEGKKIRDLITEDTIIAKDYRKGNFIACGDCDGYCNVCNSKEILLREDGDKEIVKANVVATYWNITTFSHGNDVYLFKDKKLDILFSVDKLRYKTYHPRAKFLVAVGHKTIHEYYVPDREYYCSDLWK